MRRVLWATTAVVSTLLTLSPSSDHAAFQAMALETNRRYGHEDAARSVSAVFWTLPYSLTEDYAAKALVFALQGLANRGPRAALFVNTTTLDFDFPGSDNAWHDYLARELNVTWLALNETTARGIEGRLLPVGSHRQQRQQQQQQQQQQQTLHSRRPPQNFSVLRTNDEGNLQGHWGSSSRDGDDLCALVEHFQHVSPGLTVYPDDGFSVYVALTMASVEDLLPVSEDLLGYVRVNGCTSCE